MMTLARSLIASLRSRRPSSRKFAPLTSAITQKPISDGHGSHSRGDGRGGWTFVGAAAGAVAVAGITWSVSRREVR